MNKALMASPDTTPPSLTSTTLPPVDVTAGANTVQFSVGAMDTGTGVSSVYLFFDHSWQGQYGSTGNILFQDSSDSFSDGTSTASVYFGSQTAAGTYHVTSAQVIDKAGNSVSYSASQLASMGIANSFQVASNVAADNTPPSLTSTTLPSVDVTAGANTVQFSVGAMDTGTGVSSVYLFFDHSWQGQYGSTGNILFQDSADSFSDGTSTASVYFGSQTAAGTYHVTSAQVIDKAGNSVSYSASQLASMGIANSFQVASNVAADNTPPSLTSTTLPSVDVTAGAKTVQFSVGAMDTGTGVSSVYLFFDHSWQGQYGSTGNILFQDSADSFSDGTSAASVYFGSQTAAGTYHVTSAQVLDKAGNSVSYSASQLASMGIANDFQVVDHKLASTISISGPTSVAEDVDQAIQLSLTLRNVSTTNTTVSLSYTAAGSTATNGVDVSVPNYLGTYNISQSPAGAYTINLPSISVLRDQVAEGTEYIVVTVGASGQVFDTGTDTKTFTIELVDSGQTGTAHADTLTGTKFPDHISGFAGEDTLRGAAGDDQIDGGAGVDTAVFSGFFHQSAISPSAGAIEITGPDGHDLLTNVEYLAFNDGVLQFDPDAAFAQVERLYLTVLGRAPDLVGLDFYVDQMEDRHAGLVSVANDLTGSAEFQQATGGLSNAQFVDYVYQHALNRAPDAGGKAYYTQALDNGLGRGAFVVDLSESAEHRASTAGLVAQGFFNTDDTYQAVALLYDSFFHRLPDQGGLTYYAEAVKAGSLALGQVTSDFAGSAEFHSLYDGKSNAQIVDLVYQNTLHRAPDAVGAAFYTDQLNHGMSVASFVSDVAFSQEHANLLSPYILDGIHLA